MAEPLWKSYERQICAVLRKLGGEDATVLFDQQIPGRFSGVNRQIDILVRGTFAGQPHVHDMVVDCKMFSRKLDVTHVENFVGLLEDVNCALGLLVTTEGFTPAAKRRAESVRGVNTEVIRLDEMTKWLPRSVIVATTTGSSAATLSFRDDDGEPQTQWVSLDFARQLLIAQGRTELP
ncbi:restriction endonuclease [Catenuloplanes indicus]|uniref:Restriction endonuclease type IV Mrr domain-containing protein n=1 Tax=Catenuloplanes indicus TaxID=137267 RepID=A0AAE3VZ40_9ACTN|nr:restriction endonuclease [Catenuloplanes indicus]MDQ0366868.1 hypothetical protein [Catenuloplanes indicus]